MVICGTMGWRRRAENFLNAAPHCDDRWLIAPSRGHALAHSPPPPNLLSIDGHLRVRRACTLQPLLRLALVPRVGAFAAAAHADANNAARRGYLAGASAQAARCVRLSRALCASCGASPRLHTRRLRGLMRRLCSALSAGHQPRPLQLQEQDGDSELLSQPAQRDGPLQPLLLPAGQQPLRHNHRGERRATAARTQHAARWPDRLR